MSWKEKTITYEVLAQILREGRSTKHDIGYEEYNNTLDIIMFRFGVLLPNENQEAEFYCEAQGE